MSKVSNLTIRKAIKSDSDKIHQLLMDLAAFEKIEHTVEATNESTQLALFGESPSAEAIVAELDNQIVGAAVFFHNYSTFIGKEGLYLEDIYVRPEYRGQKIGRKILFHLAKIAEQRKCGRMEWTVLDWNTRAIDFYKEMGAEILEEWKIVRLCSEGIEKLSNKEQ
ncbi:GNAT family N-acetyltransferase [Verrucomicrobia bacterium]|nr:GNAT family N-acetyltransferase [Verrucomicrobiota bacterium]